MGNSPGKNKDRRRKILQLFVACIEGDTERTYYLLNYSASRIHPDVRDPCGRTPLYVACLAHRPDVVKVILEAGARDAAYDVTHRHPYSEMNREEIVGFGGEVLLADIQKCEYLILDREREFLHNVEKGANTAGMTVLHVAVAFGHLDLVKLLCKRKYDLVKSCLHASKRRPIDLAYQLRNREIMEILLRAGSEVTIGNRSSYVHRAIKDNDMDLLKLICQHGPSNCVDYFPAGETFASTPYSPCYPPLFPFLQPGLRTWFGERIQPDPTGGELPLALAIQDDNTTAVEILLQHEARHQGSDPTWHVADKTAFLQLAVCVANSDICRLLIEAGADVMQNHIPAPMDFHFVATNDTKFNIEDIFHDCLRVQCNTGESEAQVVPRPTIPLTLLTAAIVRNDIATVRLLIERGVKLTIPRFKLQERKPEDDCDPCPLLLAIYVGNVDIVRALLDKKPSLVKDRQIYLREPNRITQLSLAAVLKHQDIVQLLCERGAPVTLPHRRLSPLIVALSFLNLEIMEILVQNMADVGEKLEVFSGESLLEKVMTYPPDGDAEVLSFRYQIMCLLYRNSADPGDAAQRSSFLRNAAADHDFLACFILIVAGSRQLSPAEFCMDYDNEMVDIPTYRPLTWCLDKLANPPSLLDASRAVVIKCLGSRTCEKAEHLEIPRTLQAMVQLPEFDEIKPLFEMERQSEQLLNHDIWDTSNTLREESTLLDKIRNSLPRKDVRDNNNGE